MSFPISNSLFETLNRSIYPLLGFDENEKVRLVGSSVFIAIGVDKFLVTAAHVIDMWGERPLIVALPTGNVEIEVPVIKSKSDQPDHTDDMLDIAYFWLNNRFGDRFVGLDYIQIDDFGYSNIEYQREHLFSFGYPSSKLYLNFKDGNFDCPPFQYFGEEIHDQRFFQYQSISSDYHKLISFTKQKVYNQRLGIRRIAPNPYGVSGGGLFRALVGDDNTLITMIFEGIMTDWLRGNSQAMKALRKEKLIEFIEKSLFQNAHHYKEWS